MATLELLVSQNPAKIRYIRYTHLIMRAVCLAKLLVLAGITTSLFVARLFGECPHNSSKPAYEGLFSMSTTVQYTRNDHEI
jgi:hypothetical protein